MLCYVWALLVEYRGYTEPEPREIHPILPMNEVSDSRAFAA